MTQLYFRNSYIYEKYLSQLTGSSFNMEKFKSELEFTKKFEIFWNKINDEVFGFYEKFGLKLADFWIAYLIEPKKGLVPFSDPLTLFIEDDFEHLAMTAIHELCHVLQIYPENFDAYNKIYDHILKVFPDNSFDVNVELVTTLLARPCIAKIFGQEKTDKFIEEERTLPILSKAWMIIDNQKEIFKNNNPIESILQLK